MRGNGAKARNYKIAWPQLPIDNTCRHCDQQRLPRWRLCADHYRALFDCNAKIGTRTLNVNDDRLAA